MEHNTQSVRASTITVLVLVSPEEILYNGWESAYRTALAMLVLLNIKESGTGLTRVSCDSIAGND